MKRALATLALALAGCSGASRLAPPQAPRLEEPQLAMTGDLDLVLRIDLELLRSALGEDVQKALERVLASAPVGEADASTSRLLLALFARAKTAWIGVRPGLSPALTDNVIVLRGSFEGLLPAELGGVPPWGSARDLGGGVLRFERGAPSVRSSPAVLYWRAPDLVVSGSYAEIDALERTVELGRGDPPLEPPETGLVSGAARLDVLRARLVERAPTLGRLAEGAERLSASAAWTGSELEVQLELTYDSAERASAVADALEAIGRALASEGNAWLGQAAVAAVERFVTVRVRLPPAVLARALGEPTSAAEGPAETTPSDRREPAPSGTVAPP